MVHSIIKKMFITLIILYSITFGTTIPKISKENEETNHFSINIIKEEKEEPIGKLIIPKINLQQDLYQKESTENTIEKHVSILKESTSPEEDNSLMILAAHSGTGEIAFFQELNKLKLYDEIYLQYNNREYIYQVTEIWEEIKNGYIHINKEPNSQLILTTCSPNKEGYQLVINSIKKES